MESIFENNKVEEFKALLLASKHVVITTHHKPDADALGSSVGLHMLLMANGIASTIVTPSDFPDFLDWMETDDMPKVEQYDEKKNNRARAALHKLNVRNFATISMSFFSKA